MPEAYMIYDIFLPDVANQEHPDKLCEEASTSWGKGANVTLSDDSIIYWTRTASLKAVSSGTDDIYYYPSTQNLARDMTGANCICFWVRANVTNAIRVSIHTDGSNYYYKDHTLAATNTWEFVVIKFSDMTQQGTFDITDVDYVQVDHKNSNRTLYLDLLCVGTYFEMNNITNINISKAINIDIMPGLFRVGDILLTLGEHSRKYNITWQICDSTKTDQQLLDDVNIVEKYFARREGMVFHSEAEGLKRDTIRGIAVFPSELESDQTQSVVTTYIMSLQFISYDNADLS